MKKHPAICFWLPLFFIFTSSCEVIENKKTNDQLLFTGGRKNVLPNSTCFTDLSCAEMEKWKELVQHKPGISVMTKINEIDNAYGSFGDMKIQGIENADGTIVNMDYFAVTIQMLPLNPITHWRFTADEFLDHIRKNLNTFVDTGVSSFSPSGVTGFDEDLIWNSSNPLGAILHIDKKAEAGNGSVICTSHSHSRWIFTTIEVPYNPFFRGYDGEHPVSGSREFGYTRNPDGSYTFYTRGVDRITDFVNEKVVSHLKDNPFDAQNILWTSFVNRIYDFTNTNGGAATPPLQLQNKTFRL